MPQGKLRAKESRAAGGHPGQGQGMSFTGRLACSVPTKAVAVESTNEEDQAANGHGRN